MDGAAKYHTLNVKWRKWNLVSISSKILTEIFFSRLRMGKGLEDMELN